MFLEKATTRTGGGDKRFRGLRVYDISSIEVPTPLGD
jgi:hypothetical protein